MRPLHVNVPFVTSSCPLRESDPTIGSSASRGFTQYVLVPRIRPATIRTYGFSAGRPPKRLAGVNAPSHAAVHTAPPDLERGPTHRGLCMKLGIFVLPHTHSKSLPKWPKSSCRSLWISEGGGGFIFEIAVLSSGSPVA